MPAYTSLSLRARRAWQSCLRTPHNDRKGFTLVELLVVISIIAILSVIGITIYSGVQKNARDANRRLEIDAVAKALETHYHGDTGKYECVADTWFTVSDGTPYRDPLDAAGTDRTIHTWFYWGIPGCTGTGTPETGSTTPDICTGYPNGGSCYTSWEICADLEADGRGAADTDSDGVKDYCQSNQQ